MLLHMQDFRVVELFADETTADANWTRDNRFHTEPVTVAGHGQKSRSTSPGGSPTKKKRSSDDAERDLFSTMQELDEERYVG